MANQETRIETDSMGEMEVPASAYYGAQTARAIENFPISGIRFSRQFIKALGMIKLAAAEVNMELGLVSKKSGGAIARAAKEVIDGKLDEQFVLDIFQTGSGTSTNMNTNEVIANRANEILGGKIGDKKPVHPNDHVNMGQSSNDVIPTAIHVSALEAIEKDLLPALKTLRKALDKKGREFNKIVKIGRTHLQDATPVRLGQEFSGYASQIQNGIGKVENAKNHLSELALGGTAVGTGINTHPEFGSRVAKKLSQMTKVRFKEAQNHFEAQGAKDAAVETSGALKTLAVSLMKIANDIRWLGSGPRCGIGEIMIPPVQPGSSIMPGKVNPVIAESVCQVAAQVVGNDAAITIGGLSGNFELNVMMPLIAHNLLQSITLLSNVSQVFADKCIAGIKADRKRCEDMIEQSLAMCTVLAPIIGYDAAAKIAKEAYETGKTVRQVALEKKVLPEDELNRVLDPMSMTKPGITEWSAGG
ncbi:MAG TPA: class II fumarate hydratase [Thermodesulfobacteriota bacterium]|nr:class II fumarate hydratase [Thermodesulfobacteriota bacterium]